MNTLLISLLRWRQPDLPRPYRTWLYPLPPLIYLGLMFWTLFFITKSQPKEALIATAIIVAGVAAYGLAKKFNVPTADSSTDA